MPITITIEAADAKEVRQLVQDLADTITGMKDEDIPADTKVSTLEQPEPKDDQEQAEKQESAKPENVPTVEEIRAKAQALGVGKKSEIKALLDEFGVKNLSAIPEDHRAEFMSRLEEL